MRSLAFDVLDLQRVTLVGQDWGGLIGLRLAAEHPHRFASIVVANTGLPTAIFRCPTSVAVPRGNPECARDPGRSIRRSGLSSPMTDVVRAAYDAPFPDEAYKVAARAMPGLIRRRQTPLLRRPIAPHGKC